MITHPSKSTLTSIIQFILIVTVAIAFLAILIPTFSTAHDSAVQNVQARAADLGRSLQEYSDDYDGALPCGTNSFVVNKQYSFTGMGWAGQVYPYVSRSVDFNDALGGATTDRLLGNAVAFAYNENAARRAKAPVWSDRSRTVLLYQVTGAFAKIDEPNEGGCGIVDACSPAGNGTIIMLLDGLYPRRVQPATGNVGLRTVDAMSDPWAAPEVDGGSFYLLGDGHVQWCKPEEVSSGGDARSSVDAQSGGCTGNAAGTADRDYMATFSTK